MRRPWLILCVLASTLCLCPSTFALVISEIHYNPGPDDGALEFVEISNDTLTPEDLTGYRIANGVRFDFPSMILRGAESVVICSDLAAFEERYGAGIAIGEFEGRLEASGERITVVDHGGTIRSSVRFDDAGKWPVEPDGTGHTLSLRDVHLDPTEPENWAASTLLGGTPGEVNFPNPEDNFVEEVLIDVGDTWRYAKGTEEFSNPRDAWTRIDFDDDDWLLGESGFGYGDDDDRTILSDMEDSYSSVAIRNEIELSAEELDAPGEYLVAIDFDDGVCVFINGQVVAEINCAADAAFDATASGARESGSETLVPLPSAFLVEGTNQIAIIGHNATLSSSDFSLIPRVVRRVPLGTGGSSSTLVMNELFRGAGPEESWVEIYNRGFSAVDLSGLVLTDDPTRVDPFVFADGAMISPGGYFVVSGDDVNFDMSLEVVRLFLLRDDGLAMAAESFDRSAREAVVLEEVSEARYPDGAGDQAEWWSVDPTPGAANTIPEVASIVINEIFYHPPEDRSGEFVELFNRGDDSVDLSGFRFDKGIGFEFPDGTMLEAGGYLVVADDPAIMSENYGLEDALGPFTGVLSNGGERLRLVDALDNPVDSVRYGDGGDWNGWADGRGSSLERVDADQLSDWAQAWDASDESEKADWERLSYNVPSFVASGETEFHFFLTEKGTFLVDDISVLRGGAGNNYIPNPGFESTTTPWRIEGTHGRSVRTTEDSHSGAACLRVEASGKGDTGVNRIETDSSPRMPNGGYEVALWARWIRGSSRIIGHGEFSAGPWGGRPGPSVNLSGNTLGGNFRLSVPLDLGTPGAENSVTRQRREAGESSNTAPLITGLQHSPPSPASLETISVQARVADSGGVASVVVKYRLDGAGAFDEEEMSDSGSEGDSIAGDGVFGARIQGFTSNRRVQFYIEAVDTDGAVRVYPKDAPSTTALLRVRGDINSNREIVRFDLDAASTSELSGRRLHSNELLTGSFVFGNKTVWQNVGIRYRGSPWGRPGRTNFRVRFPDDAPYHRGRSALNLSSRGGAATEGVAYFLVGRGSREGSVAPTTDYFWVDGYFNGARVTTAMIQPVDGGYMEEWYGEGGDGTVLKASGRLQFNDGGTRSAWDGANYRHMDGTSESYRSYYFQSQDQTADDWSEFSNLTRIMDRRVTSNALFDEQIESVLDVEKFFRVFGARVLLAGWDAYPIGNGHNGYMAFDTSTGKWSLLPFDMDNAMSNTSFGLYPTADVDIARFIGRGKFRREYVRVLDDLIENGYWNVARADPWLSAAQAAGSPGTGGARNYINSRAGIVRNQIRSMTTIPFRIRTNDGEDIETDEVTVSLTGDASVRVATIALVVEDEDPVVIEPTWTSATRWSMDLELTRAQTAFEFLTFDLSGDLLDTAEINIRTSAIAAEPQVESVEPSTGAADGGIEVTILGKNFLGDLEVFFGEARATDIEIVSQEELSVTVPRAVLPLAESGEVDITVTSADGLGVLSLGFQYSLDVGFIRGDANGDQVADLSDAIRVLQFLYAGVEAPCEDALDSNDDESIDLSDAIYMLDYLYRGGAAPPAPFPLPGLDPVEAGSDALMCDAL